MPRYAPRPSRLFRQMRRSNDPVRRTRKVRKFRRGLGYGLPLQMQLAAPFKRSMYVKMPYSESITSMTSGTLGIFGTEAVYRLGSVWDPLFSISGHQPIGRDILAQIYNKYKVYGVMVDLTFADGGGDGAVCGIKIDSSNDTTTLTGMTLETALEKPNIFRGYVNDTGTQRFRFKRYFDIGKIEGLTKSQFKNDIQQYCASIGTDPSQSPFLRIAVGNIAETSGIKVHCTVHLTYYVRFYDQMTIAKS